MTPSPPCRAGAGRSARPAAFTLVELLVAATLALVVMAALASLFALFGRAVSDSQELVQLAARMRSAAWRLRQDLQGLTTDVKPYIRPESACGYFEIIDGSMTEAAATTIVADVDDVIMLTTASPGRPFTGVLSGTLAFESPVAEVAWFCKQSAQVVDGRQLYNLYRRQLLVSAAPGAGQFGSTNSVAFTTWDDFYRSNDLSVRREGSLLIANSLADLVRRQSRFLRNLNGTTAIGTSGQPKVHNATWPAISSAVPVLTSGSCEVLTGGREGEDLLLANVIAFDVRVFDPQQGTGGAYVDLGRQPAGSAGATALTSAMPSGIFSPTPTGFVYDTWSSHIEFNGQNFEPSGSTVDPSTNFADNNGNGVVDDIGEVKVRPPYFVPLRGVEIRIRCYEPSSQETRQVTVQHSFLAR